MQAGFVVLVLGGAAQAARTGAATTAAASRGGFAKILPWLIAAAIALVLYPWAPWDTGAARFVNFIGSTMGPIFGIMMVDYYLIRRTRLNVADLYRENGEFRFGSGFHGKAFLALFVGMVFSSILPTFTSILPAWWAPTGGSSAC